MMPTQESETQQCKPNIDDYTIGLICALQVEYDATCQMLDAEYKGPDEADAKDDNTYVFGRIWNHNVVIGCLSGYGLSSATHGVRDMVRSFPKLRFALMIGIAGGAPTSHHDVRLGDVVVSEPRGKLGGVVQLDLVKRHKSPNGQLDLERMGQMNSPPRVLLGALTEIRRHYNDPRKPDNIANHISRMQHWPDFQRPADDLLYRAEYTHRGAQNCDDCEDAGLETRPQRTTDRAVVVHYGIIGTSNSLMKNVEERNAYANDPELGVLCFEMEAGGLMNTFPCLVIRGICDYCDSHKNDKWHKYAALAAAAYARELLRVLRPEKVNAQPAWIEKISTKLDDIRVGVEGLQADRHLNNVTKWLAAPDPSTNFNKAILNRHPGSGQWFLQGQTYSTWKTQENSFLWLHGIPGCGKTILSSTILQDLKANDACSPTLSLYFYFDFTDVSKQSFENAIRSLLSQLYYKAPRVRGPLDSLFSSCENGRQQPSPKSLYTELSNMIQQAGQVWVVLDALDECQEQSKKCECGLFYWIQRFQDSQMNCHILVTSRPEQEIESAIKKRARETDIVPIQSDLINEDITSYVHAKVTEHDGLRRWQSESDIQKEIENTLIEKANGMFRWVSCQLDALERCLNLDALRRALRSLPKDLNETYTRILKNLPSEHEHDIMRLLQFLTHSERPLRMSEAVDAVAVNLSTTPHFDPKYRMKDPNEIMRCCSSLAVRVESTDRYTGATVAEIQLAHFSVKDYLTSNHLKEHTAKDLEETVACSSIANVCLTYLLELNQNLSTMEIRTRFFLAQYAARYWARHAVVAERSSRMDVEIMTEILSSSASSICYRLYDPDQPWNEEAEEKQASKVAPALYYASLAGLSRCVQSLLGAGADVNAECGRYGSALQAASAEGHKEVVWLLLDKHADVNTQGGRYGTALYIASAEGHEEVVRMLLDKRVDVNAQGGCYGTALYTASAEGYKEVVRMLLDAGADVNVQHLMVIGSDMRQLGRVRYQLEDYQMQMTLIEQQNRKRLLMARQGREGLGGIQSNDGLTGPEDPGSPAGSFSSNVHAQGRMYGTALYIASAEGHKAIVRMLLDRGANVNAQGGAHGNALQAASKNGHEEVVRMLLDRGANVNARGGAHSNALQAASKNGHWEVVRMLRDAGATDD